MELATEQAGGAVGQFARETDTAAGSAQRNSAAWTDAMAALGTALLPAVTALSQKFSELATFVKDNSTAFTIIAAIIGGVAAAVLIINGALAVYNAVAAVATVVQWAMNAAWLAFPLVWIVVAIVAVIAIIVLLWNKNEAFRNAVIAIWDAIKNAFSVAVEFIKTLLSNLGDFFGKIPGWISSAFSTVVNIITAPFRSAIDAVKGYIDWFSSGFAPIAGWISGALSGIYNAITSPFRTAIDWVKGAIDGIKGAWNSIAHSINSVSVTFGPIPDWVPGIGGNSATFDPPNLPTLARGAWVTRPTLALVGEGRSAELVAPEPMLRRVLREESGSRHYSINVTVAAGAAPAEVGRQIVDHIRAFERAAGPGWRAA
jgi:phage-related protein